MTKWIISILVALTLLVAPLWADPTFDAVSTHTDTTTSLSWSHTTTTNANAILFVRCAVSTGGATSVSGITYNGVSLTEAGTAGGIHFDVHRNQMFYLAAPSTGANTVVATITDSNPVKCIATTHYDTGATGWTVHDPNTNSGTSTATQPNVTITSVAGDLVVDHATCLDNVTLSVGANQTLRELSFVSGLGTSAASDEIAAGTSTVMDWTACPNMSTWTSIGAAATPTGAPQSSVPAIMHLHQGGLR